MEGLAALFRRSARSPKKLPLPETIAKQISALPRAAKLPAKKLEFTKIYAYCPAIITAHDRPKMTLETPLRIEPARLEQPPVAIIDVVAEIAAASATLGRALHPKTAANLANLVRLMNCYYSNLIEGHDTRPRDIERAMSGDLDQNEARRNLQREAVAHIRVQAEIDRLAAEGALPEPASRAFIGWLHREFYHDAPEDMLRIGDAKAGHSFLMAPGDWRSAPEHDNAVGRHVPPSSDRVANFMAHFEDRYRFERMGTATRVLALPGAHHRFNYIHPFPDGNGRVSRLMSHAMGLKAGIGAHGLWSVSRGLARGLESRSDYKRMMDHADMPRQGSRDGRGNLSERALEEFTLWFLRVCLDQITFMAELFDIGTLDRRLRALVGQTLAAQNTTLKPEAARLLSEALMRGEIERGDVSRITGLPERSARRVLNDTITAGYLASATPRGAVSLRFPTIALDVLFPRLFPAA
jgi:Fic family protein